MLALLDDEQRALLAARLDTIHEPAGKSLFMYGDPGDSAYIVRRGVVEIYSKNDTGERLVLETARVCDFFGEIVLNVGPLSRTSLGNFDPFPFGLLTMVVSLEAIILSVFVLLSQNRQVARDRVRNDIEYQVNLKAELEIGHLHEKVDHFHQEVMRRLSVLEKASLPATRP